MTCDGLKGTLLTADELSPAARAHLASCSACRAAAERWHEVQAALRAGQAETPPPFLHARIMAGVRAARQEQAPWWRALPRTAWAGAAVAVLVVGIVAIHGGWRATRPDRTASLAESFAPEPAPAAEDTNRARESTETPSAGDRGRESEALAVHSFADPAAPSAAETGLWADDPPERAAPRLTSPEPLAEELRTAPKAGAPPAPPIREVRETTPVPRPQAETRTAAADSVAEHQVFSRRSMPEPAAPRVAGPESTQDWAPGQARPAAPGAAGAPVTVRLFPAAGGMEREISLEAATAPPVGETWVVVIERDGGVRLEDPPEEALDALTTVYRRALADLDFPPGRYRAVRP